MARYNNNLSKFTCKVCNQVKPREAFQLYIKQGYLCRFGKCKACHRTMQYARYHQPTRRKQRLAYRYPLRIDPVLGEIKRCTICRIEKPIQCFMLTISRGRPRRTSFCNPCRLEYKRQYRRGRILKPDPPTDKMCTYCGETKPLKEFCVVRSTGKVKAQCLACASYRMPDKWTRLTPEHRNRIKVGRLNSSRACAEKRRAQKVSTLISPIDYDMVYERDRGICYICGQCVERSSVSFDHVIPLSRNGTHTADNLRPVHGPCNSYKGTRTPSEITVFMPLLAVPPELLKE